MQGYTLQEPLRGGEAVGEMCEGSQVSLAHFACGDVGIYTKTVSPFKSKMDSRGNIQVQASNGWLLIDNVL